MPVPTRKIELDVKTTPPLHIAGCPRVLPQSSEVCNSRLHSACCDLVAIHSFSERVRSETPGMSLAYLVSHY
jgi:hypothetical protein